MLLRWILAILHLLALGVGLGAVWARARALRADLSNRGALQRVFIADAWWGIAAALWLTTGLWRLLAGTEKVTAYYLGNPVFWIKMGLFLTVVALEFWPAMGLIRWRREAATGGALDTSRAPTFARISYVETVLIVAIVAAATAMARGIGA